MHLPQLTTVTSFQATYLREDNTTVCRVANSFRIPRYLTELYQTLIELCMNIFCDNIDQDNGHAKPTKGRTGSELSEHD